MYFDKLYKRESDKEFSLRSLTSLLIDILTVAAAQAMLTKQANEYKSNLAAKKKAAVNEDVVVLLKSAMEEEGFTGQRPGADQTKLKEK